MSTSPSAAPIHPAPGAHGRATPAQRRGGLAGAGSAGDDLTPAQRRVLVGGIALLHGAAGWGLLQIGAVREAVLQAAPMFVSLVTPQAPPAPPAPPPPLKPQTQPARLPPTPPVVATAAAAAPAAFVVHGP
jgi:protein TonB